MAPGKKKSRSGLAAQKREFANTHKDYIRIPGFGWISKKEAAATIAAAFAFFLFISFGMYWILSFLGRL